MKKQLIITISCFLLIARLTYGADEALILQSGGSNSITLSSGTASFTLSVSSSWTGYSSIGLSYWLQVPTTVATNFTLTNVTYGTTFPCPNQTTPSTVPFNDSQPQDGADPGYTIETRCLGATVDDFNNLPGPGAYLDTTMTVNVTGLAAGTYVMRSTVAGSRKSEQSDMNFVSHDFPQAFFTIVVSPTSKARLKLSPNSGPPGASIRVQGSGFAPSEQVKLFFTDSSTGRTQLGTFTTNSNGALTAQVTIPLNATTGVQTIGSTGLTSGQRPTAKFTVT
ncbi:MAG: hypothetical protein ACREIF_12735 [Chthoniobacterales bacterium]